MVSTDIYKHINDGAGDKAYKSTDFFHRRPSVALSDELMCVNERMVGVVSILSNVLVVLVFVRVLGLTRLASRLIVSIACSNIFMGVSIILHSLAVTNIRLSNGPEKCRLLFLMDTATSALKWSCLSCAVLERIVAINMPSQYVASMEFMGPALISVPWVYWMYRMFMGFVLTHVFFQDDMGFICQHHLMSSILDDPIQLIPRMHVAVTVTFTVLLVITRTLHPPHCDDLWEVNRLKLEYKTANIIFQLLIPTFLLWSPTAIASLILAYSPFDIYSLLVIKHTCFQITIYSNPVLFLVMMKRKEFRKSFRLIFASSEAIRLSRLPNYLLAATEPNRRAKSVCVAESASNERRAPLTVAAREDFRSLITDNDMMTSGKKKVMNSSVSQWLFTDET